MGKYIDRQALLDTLPSVKEDMQISLYGAVADFIIKVNAIPAADVKPVRHGCWENIVSLDDCYFATCSCCGCLIKITKTGSKWNYCPNCGAKMDKEKRK